MLTRKTKKQIYNTVVIALLAVGLVYVCSRFIHLGVEYTDNAQVRQHITPVNTRVQGFINVCRVLSRRFVSKNTSRCARETPCS